MELGNVKTWTADLTAVLLTAAVSFVFIVFTSCAEGGAAPQNPPAQAQTVTQDPVDPTSPTIGPVDPTSGTAQYVAWGDSTTSGIGASIAELSYPAQLQAMTGRVTFNGGVSGQTSDQIAAREGGLPALLTLPNNTLPPSGPVVIKAQSTFPITAEGPGSITGTLNGFHGTLSYQEAGRVTTPQLVFTRDDVGIAETIPPRTPFHPDTFAREAQINVFWMGQNNFYDAQGVISDIAKSVGFLSKNSFIVMSLLNAGDEGVGTSSYNQLAQINATLAQTYPGHFLDIRKILVNNYDPRNPQDVKDHNNDVPPTSLRNDQEHLNDQGYALVARQVAAFAAALNW